MRKKGFLEKIAVEPYLRACAEVFITALFTFSPIVFISVPLSETDGALTMENFWTNFMSFWAAGELALSILAVSGIIVSVIVVNSHLVNRFWAFWAASFAIICLIAGTVVLPDTDGFTTKLHPQIISASFFVYFALLVIWYFLSVSVNSQVDQKNPEERAIDLLRQKTAIDLQGDNP